MRSVRVALHAHKWIDSGCITHHRVLSAKFSLFAHVSSAGNSDAILSRHTFSRNRDNAESRILSASFGSRSRQPFDYINEEIEYPFVHVVDANNNLHKDIPIEDALEMAEAAKMDLVQVAEPKNGMGPTICRLLDANKRMFELKKGVKKAAKDKEITLTPKIATHDLDVKVRRIKSFLKKGSTVRVTARWHRYENLLEKAEEKMGEITEKLLEVGRTNSSKQVENTLKLVFVPCKNARNSD
uniref:Translation initiation factor IF3 putative n=1 Tax=Albugo laibachii Nc14 TaxID=890382 RepID=F0WN39_9STRA|nr:translation initiation factor IF3 putative [Albugo laibachii Nc14]|eukprot:CCA22727.1 translation initiation factor IF3 putative [Albugo laibachii Nc14]